MPYGRIDVLREQPLIILLGSRLELGDVLGHPLVSELGDRHLAGLGGLDPGPALDDRILALLDVGEHLAAKFTGFGHRQLWAVTDRPPGLADEENTRAGRREPAAEGAQLGVEEKLVAVGGLDASEQRF